jgi:hypothetical protein
MITRAQVEKLGAMHAVEPAILSLYLAVPSHPAELGGLPARASELIAAAEAAVVGSGCLREEDRSWVLDQLAAYGRDWLGRTVAIFACAEAGLLEALPLPRGLPERAVLGTRPHIRPLLLALQRCPAYRVAVVDLAAPLVARWADESARHAADEILTRPRDGLAAIGLPACLAAVNADAVETLVVPGDGLVPGYECGRCGALSTHADSCPDWGTAPLPVPDVIEEMVSRTLEDGGQIWLISDVPSPPAARLHVPVSQ